MAATGSAATVVLVAGRSSKNEPVNEPHRAAAAAVVLSVPGSLTMTGPAACGTTAPPAIQPVFVKNSHKELPDWLVGLTFFRGGWCLDCILFDVQGFVDGLLGLSQCRLGERRKAGCVEPAHRCAILMVPLWPTAPIQQWIPAEWIFYWMI